MIALDTNVVVRILTRDDENQLAKALEVMSEPRLWLAKTVVLETAWVLRHSYGFRRSAIHTGLLRFLGLPNIAFEDRSAVLAALEDYRLGLDFADALHLRSGTDIERVVTFDARFASRAEPLVGAPRVELLR